MKKLWTMPYCPQTNGFVESCHQTTMQMIGKLGGDKKTQLARSSGWDSAYLQCHLICSARVQSILFNVWAEAKTPSWCLFPHLKEHRGPQVWCLCQTCGWIHGHCPRLIEGHSSRGSGPVYSRGLKTETVLWLENRCHRFEAWQSHTSQGRHLSRKRKRSRQKGRQASWGSTSDHDRHPLIWSERPAWTFLYPTLQLAPPHCIRGWHSLMCGCLSSTGWMYQPHPGQAYSPREWHQDNATRRWWACDHPVSG